MVFVSLNSNLSNIGKEEKIGSFNSTGDQTLTKAYTGYRFIYVVTSYYAATVPCYGHWFGPTQMAISGYEPIYFWTALGDASFRLHNDNMINVVAKGTANYMVVYGIK